MKRLHAKIGYGLIALAQYEIQIGMTQYNEEWGGSSKLGYYNYAFFLFIVLSLEAHHRYRKWHCYDAYVNPRIIMCVEEFAERVESGQQLVVLDDLVLEI